MQDPYTYNEKELLARIAEGDEKAFAIFFKDLAPILRAQVGSILHNTEDALEVLQETFIRLWLQRERLEAIEHLAAYTRQVAMRQCFTFMHRKTLRKKRELAALAEASSLNEAENRLSYQETQRILKKAVDELPAQRKRIYEMSRYEGKNSLKIANELGLSTSYVRNTLSAAQMSIRDSLIKSGKWMLALLIF